MRLTTNTAAGLSAAIALLAMPAIATADTPTGGLATAVSKVRAHTDRADAALDRALALYGRNKDRSARLAYAASRKQMGLAKAAAAKARRQAGTPQEHVAAALAQQLLAAEQDENIEKLVRALRPADGRDENAIAAAALADTKGRDKAIAILTALLAKVPEQARTGIANAIARLSVGRDAEVSAMSRTLAGGGVSKANKRRVASALKADVDGQAKASATLAALIASPAMPPASKQGLQTAYDKVTAEHGSVASILSRFSSRMPSFVRSFVEQIVTQARTDAQAMRENHPTGPPTGVPAGPPAGVPAGPPAGTPGGAPGGVPAGPPAGPPEGTPAP
jgi:hypothetical protein